MTINEQVQETIANTVEALVKEAVIAVVSKPLLEKLIKEKITKVITDLVIACCPNHDDIRTAFTNELKPIVREQAQLAAAKLKAIVPERIQSAIDKTASWEIENMAKEAVVHIMRQQIGVMIGKKVALLSELFEKAINTTPMAENSDPFKLHDKG